LGIGIGLTAWALLLGGIGQAQTLTYVESSDGLQAPKMDGGFTEVEMGDVNGDGHVDLVSVGDHGSPYINTDEHGVMVWFGDGAGGWSVSQFGTLGYGGLALGDVNGDGLMDVGYGIHHDYSGTDLGDQILEVALGDGTGLRWTAWDDGLATNGESWGMFGSDFADVDGDGDLDLGSVAFGCCAGVHVYLNQGDGSWVQSFGRLDGNSREELVFGDVNADGWIDMAVAHDGGTVYLGDGAGGFTPADANLPGGSYRWGVALGDVDGDGGDDLAYVNANGGPEVWGRSADGQWRDLGSGLPPSGNWEAAQLWDMDGDGQVDLAAFGNREFDLWKGDGAGTWTPMADFLTPTPGDYAAFRIGGDADHNGFADVAVIATAGGGKNALRFFAESSTAEQLSVRVVHPGPMSRLRSGSVRFIDWASGVPAGVLSRAAVAYSVDGVGGPWNLIEVGIPNNGRYQWTVPDLAPAADLRIAVAVVTPDEFTWSIGPQLELLAGH